MAYTYNRSPSGDRLSITRCDEGHAQLIVTSGTGEGFSVPVCVAPEDVAEVAREMLAWAGLRAAAADLAG